MDLLDLVETASPLFGAKEEEEEKAIVLVLKLGFLAGTWHKIGGSKEFNLQPIFLLATESSVSLFFSSRK